MSVLICLRSESSLCAFRHGVTRARDGRLVLVENRRAGLNDQYTVKRYRSEKTESGDEWRHKRIWVESLNPEYPDWDLDPDEEAFRILAEFVRVLD